jgi:hypothetical protein
MITRTMLCCQLSSLLCCFWFNNSLPHEFLFCGYCRRDSKVLYCDVMGKSITFAHLCIPTPLPFRTLISSDTSFLTNQSLSSSHLLTVNFHWTRDVGDQQKRFYNYHCWPLLESKNAIYNRFNMIPLCSKFLMKRWYCHQSHFLVTSLQPRDESFWKTGLPPLKQQQLQISYLLDVNQQQQ